MVKNYDCLEEFAYIRKSRSKIPGIYLVPEKGWATAPMDLSKPIFTVNDISPSSVWQGVIFVRSQRSPFFGGVFRFEVRFAKYSWIQQWLIGCDEEGFSPPQKLQRQHLQNPLSGDRYPLIVLTSECHSPHLARLAQYCLTGVRQSETPYAVTGAPFSRVLYVLERLLQWFDLEHYADLAHADVQISKSASVLYAGTADSTNSSRGSTRLISFTNEPVANRVVEILRNKSQ
ncbi:hypothetical protein TRVA0_013S00892 [Trichomonascus vanleenenianus]|uniref:uncharacterized protein n=1 Tax=Trichomonascus vanleenenianus TaxID=2268995 RepID=UPI003ECBA2E1